MSPEPLPVAVRAWTRLPRRTRAHRGAPEPLRYVLILDTESTTDPAQRLTFGSYARYRLVREGARVRTVLLERGLFHAEDLPETDPEGFEVLRRRAEALGLPLVTRGAFLRRVLLPKCHRRRHVLVGFNLPFDLSRLARGWGAARGPAAGGFSLVLATTRRDGREAEDRFRPRVTVRTVDSKRHLVRFASPGKVDRRDLGFRGRFLDLRTLAFAWTDGSHSLDSACRTFGVAEGKGRVDRHGGITPAYVDYNLRDVRATAGLLGELLTEHERHPIDLHPAEAFSPASVDKAYLRAMGVRPVLERQPDFPEEVLGAAMNAYYGGRAEARIRRVPVPVVYVDFLSMYPTVNALMGLWGLLTAERVETVEDAAGVRELLASASPERCFDPTSWRELPALALVRPTGDVLPVRARYESGGTWNIGLNPLHSEEPMWYALPDLVASVLLTGRVPEVLRAIRLVPSGVQRGLRPVRLRGAVEVDPSRDDVFRVLVEERRRLRRRGDLPEVERGRLDALLKCLANAGSYGIYAEVTPREAGRPERVEVLRTDGSRFTDLTAAPEVPGEFSFPPFAAITASGARLMLALLEREVADRGGSYACCDTDSMAIVSSRRGGLVPCPGGPYRTREGEEAVRALPWEGVEEIRERFAALNPYDPEAVPGSVLKLEAENLDPGTGERRQLWCLAISTKRVAFYERLPGGAVRIRKRSEHCLGHLMNPLDPEGSDRDWIDRAWRAILAGGEPGELWLDLPAAARVTASTPRMLAPFREANQGRPYEEQVKPFNFLLSASVAPFGHPEGADPSRFHLVAPYETDPARWGALGWTDLYSGRAYRIATSGEPGPGRVRVRSYREVLAEHAVHPEAKSLGPDGNPCRRATVGLLRRRPVRLAELRYIGKEANRLEEVASGLVHDPEEVLAEYADPEQDPFDRFVRPILREVPKHTLAEAAGIHPRKVAAIRNGHARPRPAHRKALVEAAGRFAWDRLREAGLAPPVDPVAACRVYLSLAPGRGSGGAAG